MRTSIMGSEVWAVRGSAFRASTRRARRVVRVWVRARANSYEQRTNNARTAYANSYEQRANSYEQRVRTRTNNEPGISYQSTHDERMW